MPCCPPGLHHSNIWRKINNFESYYYAVLSVASYLICFSLKYFSTTIFQKNIRVKYVQSFTHSI